MFLKLKNKKVFLSGLTLVVLIVVTGFYFQNKSTTHYKTPQEADNFTRFDMEAYDLIMQNYWKTTSEAELSQLFQLSLQKAENSNSLPQLATTTRAGTAQMLSLAFQNATST